VPGDASGARDLRLAAGPAGPAGPAVTGGAAGAGGTDSMTGSDGFRLTAGRRRRALKPVPPAPGVPPVAVPVP